MFKYLVGMCPILVLRSIAGVAEGLVAARILAGVGLFSRVGPEVSLEILQSRVRLLAALEL